MKIFDLNEGTVITREQENERKIDGKIVRVIPLYKWLLAN